MKKKLKRILAIICAMALIVNIYYVPTTVEATSETMKDTDYKVLSVKDFTGVDEYTYAPTDAGTDAKFAAGVTSFNGVMVEGVYRFSSNGAGNSVVNIGSNTAGLQINPESKGASLRYQLRVDSQDTSLYTQTVEPSEFGWTTFHDQDIPIRVGFSFANPVETEETTQVDEETQETITVVTADVTVCIKLGDVYEETFTVEDYRVTDNLITTGNSIGLFLHAKASYPITLLAGAPSDLVVITPADFGVENGDYGYDSASQTQASLNSANSNEAISLNGTVYSADLTFGGDGQYLSLGGDAAGVKFGRKDENNLFLNAFSEGDIEIAATNVGHDNAGEKVNLKIGVEFVDYDNDDAEDDVKYSIWIDDRLSTVKYSADASANVEADMYLYLPEGDTTTISLATPEQTEPSNTTPYILEDFGVKEDKYASEAEAITEEVFSNIGSVSAGGSTISGNVSLSGDAQVNLYGKEYTVLDITDFANGATEATAGTYVLDDTKTLNGYKFAGVVKFGSVNDAITIGWTTDATSRGFRMWINGNGQFCFTMNNSKTTTGASKADETNTIYTLLAATDIGYTASTIMGAEIPIEITWSWESEDANYAKNITFNVNVNGYQCTKTLADYRLVGLKQRMIISDYVNTDIEVSVKAPIVNDTVLDITDFANGATEATAGSYDPDNGKTLNGYTFAGVVKFGHVSDAITIGWSSDATNRGFRMWVNGNGQFCFTMNNSKTTTGASKADETNTIYTLLAATDVGYTASTIKGAEIPIEITWSWESEDANYAYNITFDINVNGYQCTKTLADYRLVGLKQRMIISDYVNTDTAVSVKAPIVNDTALDITDFASGATEATAGTYILDSNKTLNGYTFSGVVKFGHVNDAVIFGWTDNANRGFKMNLNGNGQFCVTMVNSKNSTGASKTDDTNTIYTTVNATDVGYTASTIKGAEIPIEITWSWESEDANYAYNITFDINVNGYQCTKTLVEYRLSGLKQRLQIVDSDTTDTAVSVKAPVAEEDVEDTIQTGLTFSMSDSGTLALNSAFEGLTLNVPFVDVADGEAFTFTVAEEILDLDNDGAQDDVRFSIWVNGSMYLNKRYYVLNFKDQLTKSVYISPGSAEGSGVSVAPSVTIDLKDVDADGTYLLAGKGELTVNGEAATNGDVLDRVGEYQIRCAQKGAYVKLVVLYKRGDVHKDEDADVVDVRDIVAMKKVVKGHTAVSTRSAKESADADRNGVLHDDDCKAVRQIIVGSNEVLPWRVSSVTNEEDVMPVVGFFGPYRSTDTVKAVSYDHLTDDIYQLVQDAGINQVTYISNADYKSQPQTVLDTLALAEKYGIGIYITDSRVTGDLSASQLANYMKDYVEYDSFKGYFVVDEPGTDDLKTDYQTNPLSKYESTLLTTNRHSNTFGYLSMYPIRVADTEDNYESYIDKCVAAGVKMLSWDFYVFENPSDKATELYFDNLRVMREKSLETGLPSWAFIQAGNRFNDKKEDLTPEDTTTPTKEQVLWNVNTSLAYGAKGIQYFPLIQPYTFAYENSDDGYDYDRNGLIGANGAKTKWYDYVQTANRQVATVDEYLLSAVSLDVLADGLTTAQARTDIFRDTYGDLLTGIDSTNGAVVGVFDYQGKTAFYVVNYNTTANAVDTITLNFNVGSEQKYSVVSTQLDTAVSTTSGTSCTLSLVSGGAALVIVE